MRPPTPPGTPSRSPRYLIPFDAGRLVRRSILGVIVVLVGGVGLYLAGVHRLASPGPLSPGHGGIETQCTQCHQPAKQVVDLRCERCHDPIDSRRYESPAHAIRAAAGPASSGHAPQRDCATCHADHGGRKRSLKQVDDTRCADCHTFSSLSGHPEFALVKAGRDMGSGIDFSHERHLVEIAKTGGDRCQSCHKQTEDRRAFEPVSFDAHCARCHVLNGFVTLNGTTLLKSGWTPEAILPPARSASSPLRGRADERGRVELERFTHREPWTIAAAARLTRAIAGDPSARPAAERREQMARLESLMRPVPLAAVADADLAAWQSLIERDVASLERAVAAGAAAPDPTAGLDGLAALDPSVTGLLAQIRSRVQRSDATGGNAADAQTVEDRRRQVAQLLAAVSARAAGPSAARVADLQKRLAAVQATASTAPAAPPVAAIDDRMDLLESALRTVEAGAGAVAVAETRALADRVRRQMSGGVDAADVAAARGRVVDLLNALDARATLPLRARIADLRETVTTIAAGDDLAQLRDRKTRLRDRIVLERTLRAEHGPATVGARVGAERDMAAAQLRLLSAHDATPPPADPPVDLDPARAKIALRGLLDACLKCHRLNEDESAMRPVVSSRSILTAATFSHQPHTNQATCDTCHTVAKSSAAVDVNLPTVKSCETCHDGTRARVDCASCHTYHPRSAAELVRVSR